MGYLFSWPFLKLFGLLVSKIVFGGIVLIGGLIFWNLLKQPSVKEIDRLGRGEIEQKPSLIRKIFAPKLKIKELEPREKENPERKDFQLDLRKKEVPSASKSMVGEYKAPPIDLLEIEKGKPAAGDTITNSTIIKKTLENFGLRVEMSEINIGPTVTQYSLKPAEGIMLSKITALSNNLSLALVNPT